MSQWLGRYKVDSDYVCNELHEMKVLAVMQLWAAMKIHERVGVGQDISVSELSLDSDQSGVTHNTVLTATNL